MSTLNFKLSINYNLWVSLIQIRPTTNVSFVIDNELGMYKEFIVQEGRVANVKAGFYHFCYNVPNVLKMKSVEDKIKESSLGYPLTKLEKSESEEC